MGGATRTRARAQARTSRERLSARRAAERRAATRRRLLLAGGSVAVVIALVVTLVVVKLNQGPARNAGAASAPTTSQVLREISSVPASTFGTVGDGTATGLKTLTGQPPLTSGGKPEVLYIGGEYCPYCAAERWALATALSRFGTLSGVGLIHSSPTDVYPSTPTMSFAHARYTSTYLSFTPVEWFGEAADPSTPFGHVYLQQPTPAEQAVFNRYGSQSIPFVDIGNRYILPQVQYLPSALANLSWTQIATDLHDPSSPVAKDIDGAANILTAAISTITHAQPSAVSHSS
jgi:hypothetical protein